MCQILIHICIASGGGRITLAGRGRATLEEGRSGPRQEGSSAGDRPAAGRMRQKTLASALGTLGQPSRRITADSTLLLLNYLFITSSSGFLLLNITRVFQ